MMNLVRRLLGLKPPEETPVNSAAPVSKDKTPTRPISPASTNVLGPPKEYTKPTTRLRFGIHSNIGGRENNEDAAVAVLVSAEISGGPPPVGVFIVADGMGGHKDGERASSLTARSLTRTIMEEIARPQLEDRAPSEYDKSITDILGEAIAAANSAVREEVPGGGTTVTCVVLQGDMAYISHVGDSRAYLFDDGELEQITRDHSMAERLREIGQSEELPMRNVLYKAVGASDHIEADSITRRLPPASRLLLCSDGLWDSLGDETMRWLLEQTSDPQQACDRLISAANTNNVEDNVTAVVVQMPE